MARLANVCNRVPLVEVDCKLGESANGDNCYEINEQVKLTVKISRDEDDDEEALEVFKTPAFAQFFPNKKFEEWWVVVGHT